MKMRDINLVVLIDKPMPAGSNGHRHEAAIRLPDALPIADDRRSPITPPDTMPAAPGRRVARQNRRSEARMTSVQRGHIVWFAAASVECLIRNLSKTGASLEVSSPVPLTFDLVFDSSDRPRRSCRVIWQTKQRLGVEFVRFDS
jgi:hypothetical protein